MVAIRTELTKVNMPHKLLFYIIASWTSCAFPAGVISSALHLLFRFASSVRQLRKVQITAS